MIIYVCIYIYICIYVYIYVYIYIEEIQGTEPPKSRKSPKFMIEQMQCPYFSLIKQLHFQKLWKGTPLGCLSTPNNVHVHPEFKNTLSPPDPKLSSIEIPTCLLDLNGKSLERKLISLEICTRPLDLEGKIHWR